MLEAILVLKQAVKITARLLRLIKAIFPAFSATQSIYSGNKNPFVNIWQRLFSVHQEAEHLQENHKLHKQQLNNAISQLSHQKIETNLTAIYELEKIAQNYPQYHWLIIELLTKFVRSNAADNFSRKLSSNSNEKSSLNIQAALTVIGRRDTTQDPEDELLDLSHTDMRGLNLNGVNLEQANLYQANFSGANLTGANLSGAILSAANFSDANLSQANLSGAILSAANLTKANLTGANLHRANLYLARLYGAVLDHTLLDGANLREAQFSG